MTDRPRQLTFEAALTLNPVQSGVRKVGVWSGYRAHWRLLHQDGVVTGNDGPIELLGLPGEAWLRPGETGTVRIYPIAPELWVDIEPGVKIHLWEGRIIGSAVVTSIHLDKRPDVF